MNCLAESVYSFFVNPITGYVIGFFSAIGLVYWQFSKSNANERIKKIDRAIRDIVEEKKKLKNGKVDDRTIAMLRNSNRFSLGVTLDRLTSAFDSNGVAIRDGSYPNFIDDIGDRWSYYIHHVKPVVDDLNQFAFLGWLPIKKMRKLNLLIKLCYRLQSIVEIHDAVMDKMELKERIQFEEPHKEYFRILRGNSESMDWLQKLENNYIELTKDWKDLLALMGVEY